MEGKIMRRGRFARANRRSICLEEVVVKYVQTVSPRLICYLLADQKRLRSKRFFTHTFIIHKHHSLIMGASGRGQLAGQAGKAGRQADRQTDIRQVGQSWPISALRSNAPYTNLGDTPADTARYRFSPSVLSPHSPDALHAEGKNHVDLNCTRGRCLITTTFLSSFSQLPVDNYLFVRSAK